MWRDDALILDIVLAASDAVAFVRGMDWDAFTSSRLHQNAVIRSLEIIGEAAGKLSGDFKDAHPEQPWRDMVNMRHRLAHAYDAVRLDVVWDVVKKRLPAVIAALAPLVRQRTRRAGNARVPIMGIRRDGKIIRKAQ